MDTIRAKRDEIYAVARRHKAEKLWVFGLCASGLRLVPDRGAPFDYTEWRRTHLYVGESLDSLADRAKAAGARVRAQYGQTSAPC